jgi:hypothetical protein
MDVDRSDSEKSIEIRIPSSASTEPIKDKKKEAKTIQENQLWNLISKTSLM